jgi:two-component system, OmpR family, sensor histidine kinase ArlS
MKLRTKIQVYSSFVLILLIILVNTAIFFLFYKTSVDAEMDRVKSQTKVIMEALAANMDTNVNPTDLLKAYIPSNGMIRIINKQGDPVHAITKKAAFHRLRSQYVLAETHKIVESDNDERFAVISVPLIWEGGEVVTLQVAEQLTTLQKTMSTLFYVLLFSSLIMIIPTVIGGAFLSNFLLKPIKQLTTAMTENPKQGEWKKIKLPGRSKDELFQMGSTYNHMIDRLKESFTKQEQFVSDASHELKTPISVIKSYTQLLERWGKEKPDVFDEATHAIRSETDRMERMIQQLLSLAKNQRMESLQFENVNLIDLVQDVARAFTVTYKRKISLYSDLQRLEVSCDREKINQVLYILLDNACKYSQGEIHVYINISESVQIAVQDFGEGLSQKDMERIFDRFYRVDKARSRETGGTGLGLSIAQFIARTHGGELTVESIEGEGSTFTLSIPL